MHRRARGRANPPRDRSRLRAHRGQRELKIPSTKSAAPTAKTRLQSGFMALSTVPEGHIYWAEACVRLTTNVASMRAYQEWLAARHHLPPLREIALLISIDRNFPRSLNGAVHAGALVLIRPLSPHRSYQRLLPSKFFFANPICRTRYRNRARGPILRVKFAETKDSNETIECAWSLGHVNEGPSPNSFPLRS
jgi:hypothetical protein